MLNLLMLLHFLSISSFLFFSGSKAPKEITVDKIQVRNGLYYAINEEKPFTGNIVDFFNNGQKRIQIEIKNGIPEGKAICWFENGFKDREFFVKGFYMEIDGSKFDYDHLQNLVLNGLFKYSEENGEKVFEEYYYNDNRIDGHWINYYSNGNKMQEGDFKDTDPFLKQIKRYDRNFEMTRWYGRIKNGKWKGWYEEGQIRYEVFFKEGKKEGTEIEWAENGIKIKESNYKEGKMHGKFITYGKEGKEEFVKIYSNGKLELCNGKPPKTEQEYFLAIHKYRAEQNWNEFFEASQEFLLVYPKSDFAPQVKFQIGYTYANEIKNLEQARIHYEEFLKQYPNHDLAGSVDWELKHLNNDINEIEFLRN